MTPKQFCEKYLEDEDYVIDYTINPDNTIDVNGDVDLWNMLGDMTKLPVKFKKVSGYFDCSWNKLTTLDGCPDYVGGSFECEHNKVLLKNGPKYVGGYLHCDYLTHDILGNVQGDIVCFNKRLVI
jgi:hypothetical protein